MKAWSRIWHIWNYCIVLVWNANPKSPGPVWAPITGVNSLIMISSQLKIAWALIHIAFAVSGAFACIIFKWTGLFLTLLEVVRNRRSIAFGLPRGFASKDGLPSVRSISGLMPSNEAAQACVPYTLPAFAAATPLAAAGTDCTEDTREAPEWCTGLYC